MSRALGIPDNIIKRVESTTTYQFIFSPFTTDHQSVLSSNDVAIQLRAVIVPIICDPVTEMVYETPPTVLSNSALTQRLPFFHIDLIQHAGDRELAKRVLDHANQTLRLGFDEQDLELYTKLFLDTLKRNPTNVELLDLAQSNSEHSRHWFFKGRLVIDGQEVPSSLLTEIMKTIESSNANSVIKFCDNSSGIVGYPTTQLKLDTTTTTNSKNDADADDNNNICRQLDTYRSTRHIIFTAETHNFPTAVEPFSGATTGTGGRIRDVQACGRGAHVIAGTAGYCFGNIEFPTNIADYDSTIKAELSKWQNDDADGRTYSQNFAAPLKIAIEASNGASDYGNKFGEPIICGFVRSFGAMLYTERCEWIKPIMFTGGIGTVEHVHVNKCHAQPGMAVVKLGGPAYRIGVGGGAASSVQVQGAQHMSQYDVHAVQRGDAQMEQKVNRALRACIEQLEHNPIRSIHDQGAGGNANVLKEIIAPCGADIYADKFQLGDTSLSVDELWIAEYQENLALLLNASDVERFDAICRRERCPYAVVGTTNNSSRIVLHDFQQNQKSSDGIIDGKKVGMPVNLPVEDIIDETDGASQRKIFKLERIQRPPHAVRPVSIKNAVDLSAVLDQILLLPSVGSKRWLTNKVDRSVTGLVAQQQCVGPWHTPLADYALIALSEFPYNYAGDDAGAVIFRGAATAIGEQPIKVTLNPARGARLTVAEALSNLVFCCITDLGDVKCSGNWMWPAKLPGEGAKLYDACMAMCEFMQKLRVAIDGGKDSLSMAAYVAGGANNSSQQTLVKSPDALVISAYAPCPDITKRVTPEFKRIGSTLMLVCVSPKFGLAGTAYAHVTKQLDSFDADVGDEMCDVDAGELRAAFNATQACIREGRVLAGHDVSDGGLLTCLLEMAFASNNIAFDVDVTPLKNKTTASARSVDEELSQILFAEPIAWVLELPASSMIIERVKKIFCQHDVLLIPLGTTTIAAGDIEQIDAETSRVRNGGPIVRYCDAEVDVFKNYSPLNALRMQWERMSFAMEHQQSQAQCVESERKYLSSVRRLEKSPYRVQQQQLSAQIMTNNIYRVGIVREEGTNGDRELAAAFHMTGFEVWDITMSDLMSNATATAGGVDLLSALNGLAFAGGFSFGDVCGSARGWAAEFKFNKRLQRQLQHFTRQRADTFTLGICNGCQVMCLLDLIYDKKKPTKNSGEASVAGDKATVELHENLSGRFESRFVSVSIPPTTSSIMLRPLRGSVLGVWVAHHEGRFHWTNETSPEQAEIQKNLALQYVDLASGEPTQTYPHNPNGSPHAVAGLCSADGRHLAMMPHPERSVLTWQWPYMPDEFAEQWQKDCEKLNGSSLALKRLPRAASPWLLMFESAKRWLQSLEETGAEVEGAGVRTVAEPMDIN